MSHPAHDRHLRYHGDISVAPAPQAEIMAGFSVSTWLAEAAQSRVRQRHLRAALDSVAAEDGVLTDAEIDVLVHSARQRPRLVDGAA